MLRKLFFTICFITCFLVFDCKESQAQLPAADNIEFDIDYCRFRTSSDVVFLEVYYSVRRDQFKFDYEENRWNAQFEIETGVFQSDSLLAKDVLNNVSYADSLSHITSGQILVDRSAFLVREGEYNLYARISDLHSQRAGRKELEVEIKRIPRQNLVVSDVQLASSIKLNRENPDKFTKNGYQVIPNASGVYGIEAPLLYYYTEIYNFIQIEENNQYRMKVSILNSNGDTVRTIMDKMKEKPGTSSVEVGGFNIVSLKSGTYKLLCEVEDIASNQAATNSKKFFVYRAGDFPSDSLRQKNPAAAVDATKFPEYQIYDHLEENEIDDEFDGCTYISSQEEKTIFKSLDLEGKRKFMKSFWASRDKDASTPLNEFRREYLSNLRHVNSRYRTGKPGWKSDQGRVFLLYGEPGEIERFSGSNEGRPYEVWNYFKIQGGVEFVFVDTRGFGEYALVHSTARNELQDSDWRRWLDIR